MKEFTGKLMNIYSNMKNPIDDDKLVRKLIKAYSNSQRTDAVHVSDLYDSLVTLNSVEDKSKGNLKDEEAFKVELYNQWIDNILKLGDNDIKKLEEKIGMDAGKIQQYFKDNGKISTMKDIKKLNKNPLFGKEVNLPELSVDGDGWEHFKSKYISVRKENSISVKHRLYINCQNQDLWKVAKLFKNKCERQKIPFYFKLSESSKRDDKIVIYADTNNLENYISILQEIANDYPEIRQRVGNPPALTGKIDGWIGIGDEPVQSGSSYNLLRAGIIENAVEETVLNEILQLKGKEVLYNGNKVLFNDLFKELATQVLIEKAKAKSSYYGLDKIENKKLENLIKENLKSNIMRGIKRLIDVKDEKNQLAASNRKAIFEIQMPNGKNIEVDTYDMDKIIKQVALVMPTLDLDFIDKVRSQIQVKSRNEGIDDTFCFQRESRERFVKENSSYILDENAVSFIKKEINDTLLKRNIKFKDGSTKPAMQYITRILNSTIPGNYKVKLDDGTIMYAREFFNKEIKRQYDIIENGVDKI